MILLFDTSTPTGILVFGDATQCVTFSSWQAEHSHSQKLPPAIDSALQQLPMGAKQLSNIAVGVGPGSFTGLRVALATAKGLGIALQLPLIAIPSPELFAAAAAASTDYIVTCIDAFRAELYLGIYKLHDGVPLLQGEICSVTPAHAAKMISALQGTVTITGTGYDRYAAEFPPQLAHVSAWNGESSATTLLKLADHYRRAGRTEDAATLQPLYVREAEAVEKRRA